MNAAVVSEFYDHYSSFWKVYHVCNIYYKFALIWNYRCIWIESESRESVKYNYASLSWEDKDFIAES